jgi:dTDP-4-dehydrorhamnose reductase
MRRIDMPLIGSGHADADITQQGALFAFARKHPGITHIVNCAGFTQVDPAEHEREKAFAQNAVGPANLAEVASVIGARLIHLSTDYVFDGSKKSPWREEDPTHPLNWYGVTKLEGEKRVAARSPDARIIRTSFVFGDGKKNIAARLLARFAEEEEIALVDDQVGRPTYADDLAEAIASLLKAERMSTGRNPTVGFGAGPTPPVESRSVYHFANQGEASKWAFGVFALQEAQRLALPIRCQRVVPAKSAQFPTAARRPPYSVFDTAKIERDLGLSPRPWQKALTAYLEVYASTR